MPESEILREPTFADIEAAAGRLAGQAVVTPLLEFATLNQRVGGRVLIKPENLQRTGSFKFRGAYNKLSQLSEAARKAGVAAYSSGNHAQGVAAAAALLNVPATIVMPADAPAIKIEKTRGYGAEVVLYERNSQDRAALAAEIAAERGLTMVRPFDDPEIIAGQGTCGLEIAQQAAQLGAELDAVLICCGGGGLVSGSAVALERLSPATAVYSVEPAEFDDTARSLAAGHRLANEPGGHSICDALLAPTPGELTFALNKRRLKGGLAVSDQEVATAVAYAFRDLKLVVEPGGAVALAAVLAGHLDARGKIVAITLSGGNIDADSFAGIVTAGTQCRGKDPASGGSR